MMDIKEIFYEILQIKGDLWMPFLLGLVVVAGTSVVLAFRYKWILHFLNEKINLFDSFNIVCSSQFISYMFPFKIGSIVTKPLITKAVSSITYKKSVLASVFEQFFDITWQILLLPVFIYVVGSKYFIGTSFFHLVIIIILLVGIIVLIINLKKVIGVLWKIKFMVPKFVRNFSRKQNISKEKILELIEKSKFYLKNKKMFFVVTIITFIHFVLAAMTLQVFLIFFGYYVPYHFVLAGFWASAIIGRLSGLPLGLGARDISLGVILVAFNVALGDSIRIVVFVRLIIIITLTLFGVFFLGYNTRKIKNFRGLLRERINP